MAVAIAGAATRRLLLAPARRRAFWSSPWAEESPHSPGPSADENKKKKPSSHHRLAAVMDAVADRKLPPELRGRANAVRSETDIINVVEQRIWHSMEEGHFENLPGKGKPLNLNSNPHADPAEDTLYRILSRNGCAPEWVELNKEIRGMIARWRSALRKAWANRSEDDRSTWHDDHRLLQEQIRQINDKVFRYNLIMPFGRQMFGLNWDKELDKLKHVEHEAKGVEIMVKVEIKEKKNLQLVSACGVILLFSTEQEIV
uniref:DnaJ homologue subfamily C member 28 conserved domain-containing protein n=1 Tax=Oryza nivara TaxID=4536 RepID=A0A0E0IFU2_ORYNI